MLEVGFVYILMEDLTLANQWKMESGKWRMENGFKGKNGKANDF